MLANKEIVSASRLARRDAIVERRREGRDRESLPRWSLALLRAVTHEIRSPLTVIRAYSSVALQPKTRLSTTEMIDLMRRIDRSARLVEVIVGDLEALAKQESVQMRLVALELAPSRNTRPTCRPWRPAASWSWTSTWHRCGCAPTRYV